MRARPLLALATLATMLGVSLASPAHACWDGYLATVDRVTIAGGDDAWSPTLVRAVARWGTRVSALLPPGMTALADLGAISFTCDAAAKGCVAPPDERWTPSTLERLFDHVAAATHASAATIASARTRSTSPWTVQIAAFGDAKSAEKLAERVEALHDQGKITGRGFIDVGGFPATNPIVHVVPADVNGKRVWRVVVDAFLDRGEADATRDEIARVAKVQGFVRAL